jgi:hypothetical protein
LKCLQTALRPEGFGEECLSGSGNMSPPDPNCIGEALAKYMNEVISSAGTLLHIKLLSPAFNMTNPIGYQIANAMDEAGADWASLAGIAGNAFNCCEDSITGHVNTFLANARISGLPVMLTETGKIDGSLSDLASEIGAIKGNSTYLGALLKNAFNTNTKYSSFALNNGEIRQVCDGDCDKVGVNSADFYHQSDSFYSRADSDTPPDPPLAMQYTLEISKIDGLTTTGVEKAFDHDLTPIIRVGTENVAGPDAASYGAYLKELDQHISQLVANGQYDSSVLVYAIAGPNEPQTERWAAPECGSFVVDPEDPPVSGSCEPGTGYCSPTALQPYFGQQANNASQVCNKESGSYEGAFNGGCETCRTLDWSVGLFQINMLAHPGLYLFNHPDYRSFLTDDSDSLRNALTSAGFSSSTTCVDAFTYSGSCCTVLNRRLANVCKQWFLDPIHNIKYAAALQKSSGWSPWSGARACGIY